MSGKRHEVSHWEVWRVNNAGANPTTCCDCIEDLRYDVRATHKLAAVIHHVDGDHSNNDYSNLRPLHHGCHARHHMLNGGAARAQAAQDRTSPEYRAAISRAAKARLETPEGQAGMQKFRAAAHTYEANEKRRVSVSRFANSPKGQEIRRRPRKPSQ